MSSAASSDQAPLHWSGVTRLTVAGVAIVIAVAAGWLLKIVGPLAMTPSAKANRPDTWLQQRYPRLRDDHRAQLLALLACAGLAAVLLGCFGLFAMALGNGMPSTDG